MTEYAMLPISIIEKFGTRVIKRIYLYIYLCIYSFKIPILLAKHEMNFRSLISVLLLCFSCLISWLITFAASLVSHVDMFAFLVYQTFPAALFETWC